MNNKYYIVGVSRKEEGIFAIVTSVINHSLYAIKNGFIPIVDMKHYKNQYFKDNMEYKENSWEYFFEQPCNVTLDDIKKDDNITIGENCFKVVNGEMDNIWIPIENNLPKNSKYEKIRLKYRELLKFKPDIKNYFEENYKQIVGDKNVLGILCRGTDYLNRKPLNESRQPHPKIVIEKAKSILKKYPEINNIYLATEDKNIYDMFKKEFGEILLENPQYMYSYKGAKYLAELNPNRENHNYNLALEYMSSIYILSKCKYFIGGRTTGTKWAWILSDNWKYSYIWELGFYGHEKFKLFDTSINGFGPKCHKIINIFGFKFKIKIKV